MANETLDVLTKSYVPLFDAQSFARMIIAFAEKELGDCSVVGMDIANTARALLAKVEDSLHQLGAVERALMAMERPQQIEPKPLYVVSKEPSA